MGNTLEKTTNAGTGSQVSVPKEVSNASPVVSTSGGLTAEALTGVKEFCEHIRAVQIGLLGICLVLLGVLIQDKPKPLNKAIADVTAMEKLAERKTEIDAALQRHVDQVIGDYLHKNEQRLQLGKPVYVLGQWRDGTKRSLRLDYPFIWTGKGLLENNTSKVEFNAQTPGEFKGFWLECVNSEFTALPALSDKEIQITFTDDNTMGPGNSGQLLVMMPDLEGFKNRVRAVLSLNEIESNGLLEPIGLTLKLDSFSRDSLSSDLPFRLDRGDKHVHVFSPEKNRFIREPLNLLPTFLQASGMQGEWAEASFGQVFAEVNTQMSDVSDRKFKDAVTYLKRESTILKPKPDESVDVYGVKLSAATVSNWGIALILGFQLYLLVLLFQLAHLFATFTPNIPNILSWSGLFSGLIARGFTLTSCAFLPFAILLYLAYFEFRKWPDSVETRILYSLGVAVSLTLCLGTIFKLRRIWLSGH